MMYEAPKKKRISVNFSSTLFCLGFLDRRSWDQQVVLKCQ